MAIKSVLPGLICLLILSGCLSGLQNETPFNLEGDGDQIGSPASVIPPDSEEAQSGWYQVYFSDSGAPNSSTLRGGPDAPLVEAIDRARLSVDIAMDDLDLWSLRAALTAAHSRGVTVRVVVESDNLDEEQVRELIEAGVPVVADQGGGLMHNKFVIVDRLEVWTGSMNFTVNGAYRSNNNLIRIRSADLAQNYLVEFEEMFLDRQFGSGSPANTPFPVLDLNGTQVEVYFSPDDGTINRLLELVQGARESVLFLAYSFTDDDLAQAVLDRADQDVLVRGVFDESQALGNIGGEYTHLLENGIDVRLDGNPRGMHHKVILIDDRIVISGSYNFSNNAKTRNDENTLIIHSPEMAALYRQEFERVWREAKSSVE
jgi:phosphatidylserine/phosphatidylglycerophosphate/cardiolipin synthase-like enzyme